MRLRLLTILTFCCCISGYSQKEVLMTQYMHNRYAVNTAFAGSAETFSALLSARMQWTGMNDAPKAQFFSMHAPLKNDNIALGLSAFNENVAIAQNTGLSASYAYRVRTSTTTRLAFSISGGFYSARLNWHKVNLQDETDEVFRDNENYIKPALGFGMAWYGTDFFLGLSIPDMFYNGQLAHESSEIELSETDYFLTGGYLFPLGGLISMQPSFLVRFKPSGTTVADLSASFIYDNTFWLGAAYRTNSEIIALAAWQATPQLRVIYSYDYPTGDLSNMNSGSHEISLKFDFGYKVNTVSPRFF
jgi:type IX secretion system PorP/SprF family membrane protein